MAFSSGRVLNFLRNADGEIKGLLLANGIEIRFPAVFGHLVTRIVSEGSHVTIEGIPPSADSPDGHFQAISITNLDSGQNAILATPRCQVSPGMLLSSTPDQAASLAPLPSSAQNGNTWDGRREDSEQDTTSSSLAETNSKALPPASYFRGLLQEDVGKGKEFMRNDAARSVGIAYDSLHRIQAILAYLHLIKHSVPGIGQFLDEAKHTYEQALARFSSDEFAGAKEFAEASRSLAHVVEIVMSRTLRSDSSLPSLVPPPPEPLTTLPESEYVEENLAQAEAVLSRIHWLLANGTLPSEDRAQVRKIASWGDAFCKQARRTYRDAVLEDAAEFAQAALAGAYSAEHICRKWYLSHPVHP